jgi:hypothetical protein
MFSEAKWVKCMRPNITITVTSSTVVTVDNLIYAKYWFKQ